MAQLLCNLCLNEEIVLIIININYLNKLSIKLRIILLQIIESDITLKLWQQFLALMSLITHPLIKRFSKSIESIFLIKFKLFF
jgi:hypothetical protein